MAGEQGSSTATLPTTVRLQNIAQSYGQSAALMAAVEVGLFTAISSGAGTYEEVARALDIHPTNAERLMVMLCAAGLIEKQEGRHSNAADVERFLVEGKPGHMGRGSPLPSRSGTSGAGWPSTSATRTSR